MVWDGEDHPQPLTWRQRFVRGLRYRVSAWAERLERVFQGM